MENLAGRATSLVLLHVRVLERVQVFILEHGCDSKGRKLLVHAAIELTNVLCTVAWGGPVIPATHVACHRSRGLGPFANQENYKFQLFSNLHARVFVAISYVFLPNGFVGLHPTSSIPVCLLLASPMRYLLISSSLSSSHLRFAQKTRVAWLSDAI